MAVFQPTEILVRDQQTIQLIFSSQPSLFLTKANFSIASTFTGATDLDILSIEISDFTITLNTRPQFPNNLYLIHLLDISTQVFEDTHNVRLSDFNDARNVYFVGVEDINPVRDTMLQNLPPNYDTGDQTLVRDLTAVLADEINIAGITLEEIKNDNYISIPIVDELYIRGTGPTDRLKNEGTYNVSRVSRTITGTNASGMKTLDPVSDPNIPFEVINLRVMEVEELVPNGKSTNKFDGFLITVSHQYVTKLFSVILNPGDVLYDPSKYGYALLNNNYDRFARPSPILKNNQILLSSLTNGEFPEPIPGDILTVIYEFDNVGRRVDGDSISLYTVLKQINEGAPASVTSFYLEFANIVNEAGQTVVLGGVEFNISTINLNNHPSFLREIVFNTDSLPSAPGEYTINYTTGQVFVFGTQTQLGTGPVPPVATYFYKNIAVENTDYYVSDDGYNVSLNPFSQFAVQEFVITFLYEDVLTPGVDYLVSSHNEVLNERINNRLISDFEVEVTNGSVKDVYQVLNETTGESYTPGLVERNKIFFAGNVPPATSVTNGELAQVGHIPDEVLNVGIPTTTPNTLLRVFPISLAKHPILNQREDAIGSSFNTSIQITRDDLFIEEFFFNPIDSIYLNLGKLKNIGDYLVDYATGNMYLGVSSTQNFDVGHISYAYGVFIPNHAHVLGVTSIGLGTTSTHIIQDFELGAFEDGIIIPKKLNYGYDSFDGLTRVPNSDNIFVAQLQDNFTVYTKYPIKKVYGVFTQNDVDAYGTADLLTKNLFDNSVNSFFNTVIDLKTYIVLSVEADTLTTYKVIIPDVTTVVKSIIVVDTNTQLLDTQLYIIKYKNILIKTVVPIPLVNPTTATVTIQNNITLLDPLVNSLVDIAGHRFPILSLSGGNILTVSVPSFTPPVINPGSQILDHNGILIADHLNIISVTELPDLLYILHYDFFPGGILIGYQAKDSAGNIFSVTDVQSSSVVVAVVNPNIIPVIDPTARIETQSMLSPGPGIGETTLQLPHDAPIIIGTNLQIGYVPETINQLIIAANQVTNSAGGAGLVIDYSIGQFFIDYRHLDDELLVSYDWGDNQLDWSISDTLKEGDPYYVSYQYGASRNGLETNFGSLTNVDFLQSAPLSISRETYRTAVSAAIKAFLKGPTHEAIRLLAHAFTQIDPEIKESALNQWIVGRDPLGLQDPITTGQLIFGNGKYSEGLVITGNDSIQLPGESSLRLAQGTFSTWFRPNWSGNQADDDVMFNLPTALFSVYYNAHSVMPQDVESNPWYLDIGSDSYGTAYVNSDYLEVHNSKNDFTGATPTSLDYLLDISDGYFIYPSISSTSMLHDSFTSLPYTKRIGTYTWKRNEPILSVANDLDIEFSGYVHELSYVNSAINVINVANVIIDDGYSQYNTGFYLSKRNLYAADVILEDVHLTIEPPYPHTSPPIVVSTFIGSNTATVISGDTSTLTVGQQVTIGTAFPTLTNIIGYTATTVVLRTQALTTLTNVFIGNLDPPSHPGTQDGYSEIHLQDKLGTRPLDTIIERTNGWERQLLVKIRLTPFASGHLMELGSSDPPLTTGLGVVLDFLDSILPGGDVFVDGYGNAFEIDHVELPYVWLKKPAGSGAPVPTGVITAFRKVAGIQMPDETFISIPVNWSETASCSMKKRNGLITLDADDSSVSSSYVLHYNLNTSGVPNIRFGQIDVNIDSIVRVQSVYYNIHSLFGLDDVYIGNTGNNPTTDSISFKYDINTTGIPAIDTDKYFAIFTSKQSASIDEPTDEVFVKMKVPSIWELDDGTNTLSFPAVPSTPGKSPTIKFSVTRSGDVINIADGYGLTYRKATEGIINFTAIDTAVYTPGNASILLDEGPELRIAIGKRHFLFDVETPDGALRLYRSGNGFLTAEVQVNDPVLYNIRSDISDWSAGQLHHIAMSWKISSPDETDELHLFIDGDEVPNEVTFGSGMEDGYIGQVYEEFLTVIPRIASSDGYIVNDINGSGLFIPSYAAVQPDDSWIDKTIVLNATMLGPNIHLDEPLIVGNIISVVGGVMLFLSQFGVQLDFSLYGPSTPVLYGLATSATAVTTILVRSNFAVFQDGVELMGPNSATPEFRQVSDTQVIELYDINPLTGQYVEIPNITTSAITIKTYGLLTQRVKERVYQFGSLIRSAPIVIDVPINNQITTVEVAVNEGGPAFITDLPPPVDPTQVTATKILLPRVMI